MQGSSIWFKISLNTKFLFAYSRSADALQKKVQKLRSVEEEWVVGEGGREEEEEKEQEKVDSKQKH